MWLLFPLSTLLYFMRILCIWNPTKPGSISQIFSPRSRDIGFWEVFHVSVFHSLIIATVTGVSVSSQALCSGLCWYNPMQSSGLCFRCSYDSPLTHEDPEAQRGPAVCLLRHMAVGGRAGLRPRSFSLRASSWAHLLSALMVATSFRPDVLDYGTLDLRQCSSFSFLSPKSNYHLSFWALKKKQTVSTSFME